MSYKIDEKCIMCDACPKECPVGAIKPGKPKYVIDSEVCIDCGICEGICPESAISPGK